MLIKIFAAMIPVAALFALIVFWLPVYKAASQQSDPIIYWYIVLIGAMLIISGIGATWSVAKYKRRSPSEQN